MKSFIQLSIDLKIDTKSTWSSRLETPVRKNSSVSSKQAYLPKHQIPDHPQTQNKHRIRTRTTTEHRTDRQTASRYASAARSEKSPGDVQHLNPAGLGTRLEHALERDCPNRTVSQLSYIRFLGGVSR